MIKLGKKGHRHSARLLPPHIYCIGQRDIACMKSSDTPLFLPLFSHKYTILRCKHWVPNLFSPARDFLSIQRIHAEKEVKGETLLSRFFPSFPNILWMSPLVVRKIVPLFWGLTFAIWLQIWNLLCSSFARYPVWLSCPVLDRRWAGTRSSLTFISCARLLKDSEIIWTVRLHFSTQVVHLHVTLLKPLIHTSEGVTLVSRQHSSAEEETTLVRITRRQAGNCFVGDLDSSSVEWLKVELVLPFKCNRWFESLLTFDISVTLQ